jgi:hypothetical protein
MKVVKLKHYIKIILPLFFLWEAASAQDSSAKSKERRATLNFEDELVEGATQKPELFYLFQKKNFNYRRLIKLRENFLPEMRKTAEDVQRVRGGT